MKISKRFRKIGFLSSLSLSLWIRDLRSSKSGLQNFSAMASQIVYGLLFLSFSFTCIMLLHLILHPVFYFTSWNLEIWSFDFRRSIGFNGSRFLCSRSSDWRKRQRSGGSRIVMFVLFSFLFGSYECCVLGHWTFYCLFEKDEVDSKYL